MSKKKMHNLKIDKAYIFSVKEGHKTCEVRFNDRDYQKGDEIHFDCDGQLSGCWEITHVLTFPTGLKDGYVVLSIKKIRG